MTRVMNKAPRKSPVRLIVILNCLQNPQSAAFCFGPDHSIFATGIRTGEDGRDQCLSRVLPSEPATYSVFRKCISGGDPSIEGLCSGCFHVSLCHLGHPFKLSPLKSNSLRPGWPQNRTWNCTRTSLWTLNTLRSPMNLSRDCDRQGSR